MENKDKISVVLEPKDDEQAGSVWIRVMASYLLLKSSTNLTEGEISRI